MIYVASPYSSDFRETRQRRYEAVRDWIAACQSEYDEPLYSPIVHWHEAAAYNHLPTDAAFWWSMNKQMIDIANRLIVLGIDGYEESKGVNQEIEYWKQEGYDVEYIFPSEI
jgi:hypothetical protein